MLIIVVSQATLISLLSQHSVPLVDCGIAVDEPDSLLERLRACLDRGDVVVTTGGVSMGDRDILRKVGGLVSREGESSHVASSEDYYTPRFSSTTLKRRCTLPGST